MVYDAVNVRKYGQAADDIRKTAVQANNSQAPVPPREHLPIFTRIFTLIHLRLRRRLRFAVIFHHVEALRALGGYMECCPRGALGMHFKSYEEEKRK